MVESISNKDINALNKMSKGDLNAYRYLFDSYFSDLCNFLKLYFSDQTIAEDIALEIFVSLWEKRKELKIKSSVKGYLFQSAKYKAISHLRKERKEIFTQLDVSDISDLADSEPRESIEIKELRKIIDEAINSLPEKSRIIYRMAWEENLPHKLIAEKLDISPKTVENQVGIALKKLRDSLKPYYDQIFFLCLIYLSG